MSPLNKTKIEWVKNPDNKTQGFSENPVKGRCPVGCKWCYAWGEDNPQALCKRFKWDTKLRFDPKVLKDIERRKKPAGIFMCSTMELFHPKIDPEWRYQILRSIGDCQQHRFYVLTKQPEEVDYAMPANIWMGVTVTGHKDSCGILEARKLIATVKFLSFEPLLYRIYGSIDGLEILTLAGFHWIILGAQTGGKKADRVIPKKEWVEPILEQADKYKIPVFIKNNMKTLVNQWGIPFRQEMPQQAS